RHAFKAQDGQLVLSSAQSHFVTFHPRECWGFSLNESSSGGCSSGTARAGTVYERPICLGGLQNKGCRIHPTASHCGAKQVLCLETMEPCARRDDKLQHNTAPRMELHWTRTRCSWIELCRIYCDSNAS